VERDANYLAVGSFVLLVLVMGVLFVYWYSDSREHRHYQRYEIYFDGSVSGLTEGGAVRYLGVDVGRVQRMRVDPRAANRVQVIADIDASAPISDRTIAQLQLQGVTGLLYIDLTLQREVEGRLLESVPSETYPVIRSAHSDFDVFLSSLPDLTARLNELVVRATRILSDRNIAAIQGIIGDVERASAGLPQSARALDALLGQLRDTTADARAVIGDLHAVTRTASVDFLASMQQLHATSDNLAGASAELDAFVGENRTQLSGFVRTGLPQLEGLLRDSREATQQIRDLSRSLNENPSRLVYQPPVHGVAIPP
jgi:phospholipid/cholesterol/gamma-HCH transport system substrate-binding protein